MPSTELTKEEVERRIHGEITRWVDRCAGQGQWPPPATGTTTQGKWTITVDEQRTRELARAIVDHDFAKDD